MTSIASLTLRMGYLSLQIYPENHAHLKDCLKYDILVIDTLLCESIKVIRAFDSSKKIIRMIEEMVCEFRQLPRMSRVTQNKTLNMLNNFSHPGGPYFPPRELR